MIDDYAKAMELVRKIKAHLPIPARPTKAFIKAMRSSEIKVRSGQKLQIESVLYTGDEGGISCAIQLPGAEGTVTLASLTHIRVPAIPCSKKSAPIKSRASEIWLKTIVTVHLLGLQSNHAGKRSANQYPAFKSTRFGSGSPQAAALSIRARCVMRCTPFSIEPPARCGLITTLSNS